MSRELFVAYFRVGVGRQGYSELGLEAQHRAVSEYLDGGARELVGEYTEIERGQRHERPQLARALAACRRHNATLIIARLDRLARDASALFPIFDGIGDCDVVFCDPPQANRDRSRRFSDLPASRAYGPDRRPAFREAREAAPAARAPGEWVGPSFGDREQANRRTDGIASRLADQRAASTLPIIHALRASGISTLQGMADALNERGIPTARGARWYPTTVRNMLGREVQDAPHAAA
jgi:hypothetical protein